MPVKPLAPRHTTKDFGDKLVIWVPNRINKPVFIIVSAWALPLICIGVFFLLSGISHAKPDNSGLSSLLIPWIMVAAFFLFFLSWQFFGKEEIEISDRSIKISPNIFGIRFPKEYLAEHIQSLGLARVSQSDLTTWGRASIIWNLRIGNISFDYGARTYKFAGGVFDAEAKQIIAEIQQKYPQYKN
jgi:hypothetical protein